MNKLTSVIYARVSSVGDRQSTERQVVDLNNYASRNNLEVVKVFEEHISGAKKNSERAVLCDCLDYCFENHVHTLLISGFCFWFTYIVKETASGTGRNLLIGLAKFLDDPPYIALIGRKIILKNNYVYSIVV